MKTKKGDLPEQSENRRPANVSSTKQLPHGVEGSVPALKSKPAMPAVSPTEEALIENERRLMADRFADTLARELAKQQAEDERTIDV